jgi:endoglucanase
MKNALLIIAVITGIFQNLEAQIREWPKMKSFKLTEIRTATNNILVAYFIGPEMNEISNKTSEWSLNGTKPDTINKWVTPNWSGIEFGYEHHLYLTMKQSFIQGQQYKLKTPYGDTTFIFEPKEIFCESIKTNQSGYSVLSNVRYANFAFWTGTGGGVKLQDKIPSYEVIEINSGKSVVKGFLTELGENKNSGDFVYRINISQVPKGGPYKIVVNGIGCSYPFGVGGEYTKHLAYVSFRGLLHQRCGIEQKQPYFDHDIRGKCHSTVHITNSKPKEAKITITPSDPIIKMYGGYHDAGDADHQANHIVSSIVELAYYDLFPQYFTDLQYNIPDKFDADFNPIGQGNGIPDIIDEAEWGTAVWELFQDKNGGVHNGTERNGYPSDAVGLDKDTAQYGTFRVSKNATTLAAGLFAHLSRELKTYNPQRSLELQKRAERAWAYAGDSALPAHQLYFYVQYYLLTGNKEIHKKLIRIAPIVNNYVTSHLENTRNVTNSNIIIGSYFVSYLTQNIQPKDTGVVRLFKNAFLNAATNQIIDLEANPWPNGSSKPNRWWGSQTAQGQYADPLLIQWKLTGEQKYIDAASQLMDYNQGLNPVGKSYLTGIGFDRTSDPLHHDSYPMKEKGWGSAPGIQVFGPGCTELLKESCPKMIPDINSLPAQRQYMDNRRNVSANEFTIPESLAYPSVIYTILSEGGIWDRKTTLSINHQ